MARADIDKGVQAGIFRREQVHLIRSGIALDAFRQAGGNIEFHLLPAFGDDGHRLMGAAKGVPIWAPIVEAFLARVR